MAAANSQPALIGLRAYSSDGLGLMKKAVAAIGKIISIAEASSVYRIQSETEQSAHIHDLRTHNVFFGFVMTVRGFTMLTPELLNARLKNTAAEFRSEA